MRLRAEPKIPIGTVEDLVGFSLALERQTGSQFIELAEIMDRRAEPAVAALFRALALEEVDHASAIIAWAAKLGVSKSATEDATSNHAASVLPAELIEPWHELGDSTLVTAYRALAIAVVTETHAAACYAYIAANATSSEIAAMAETLAAEEFLHAARLRPRRRDAYRSEKVRRDLTERTITDAAAILFRQAAAEHRRLTGAFAARGQHDAARELLDIAHEETVAADAIAPATPVIRSSLIQSDPSGEIAASSDYLWRRALQPIEEMTEIFDKIADKAGDETTLSQAVEFRRHTGRWLSAVGALRRRDWPVS